MICGPQHSIELINPELRRPNISHVIFDFDGTLSWLRHGWPRVMLDVCLGYAPSAWQSDSTIQSELLAEILSLNGKPSIHQINRFCDRAGSDYRMPSPQTILGEYQKALHAIVKERAASAPADPHRFVIDGANRALTSLRDRGVTLIILSGTIEMDVRREAELLGLKKHFGNHIYGSTPNGRFSKKDVIDHLLQEERIEGHHLLAFGDGPVEIAFTKAVGGLAIGVASDEEENGSHRVDSIKRAHLIAAGADAIIPDYVDIDDLLPRIFGR